MKSILGLGIFDEMRHLFLVSAPSQVRSVPHPVDPFIFQYTGVGDGEGVDVITVEERRPTVALESLGIGIVNRQTYGVSPGDGDPQIPPQVIEIRAPLDLLDAGERDSAIIECS